jgi:predicted protein tyrosine phosphatase
LEATGRWVRFCGAGRVSVSATIRKVLFICSRNQWRSPTAEKIFSAWHGLDVMSAGLDPSAVEPVTPEHLEWAEVIFVMERKHRMKLSRKFQAHLKNRKIVVLGIPDRYRYMDPELVALFEKLVPPHLGMAKNGWDSV